MFLSSLATLNFSLALIVGLLATPLSFIQPCKSVASKAVVYALLNAVSPVAVVGLAAAYWGVDVASVVRGAAVGWGVCGTYSPVVVWCVWWPAWVAGGVVVLGGGGKEEKKVKSA
jgi:glycosylphosphatidylinositol transamidase